MEAADAPLWEYRSAWPERVHSLQLGHAKKRVPTRLFTDGM